MPKRLIITVVCFHIIAVLLGLAGAALLLASGPLGTLLSDVSKQPSTTDAGATQVLRLIGTYTIVAGVFHFVLLVTMEALIVALNRRRYWAWIIGLVVCGLTMLGGFSNGIGLVLGGLALWGLVDPDSVAAFRPSNNCEIKDVVEL